MKNLFEKTEKKYWVNGLQIRGKDFYTLNGNIGKYGFMFSFSYSLKHISLSFFKLTN